jgi:RecG-like helicase
MPDRRSKLEQYAEGLQVQPFAAGSTRIRDLEPREVATVVGVIHSLTLRPRSGIPALEADIEDGSGRVTCIWLGRRAIRGIAAGRDIIVTGRFTRDGRNWRVYNPVYQLRPGGKT